MLWLLQHLFSNALQCGVVWIRLHTCLLTHTKKVQREENSHTVIWSIKVHLASALPHTISLTVYPHCFAACVCLRGDYLSAAGCRQLLLLANGQEVFNVEGTADFTENLIDSLTLISPLPSAISLAESLPKSHLQ